MSLSNPRCPGSYLLYHTAQEPGSERSPNFEPLFAGISGTLSPPRLALHWHRPISWLSLAGAADREGSCRRGRRMECWRPAKRGAGGAQGPLGGSEPTSQGPTSPVSLHPSPWLRAVDHWNKRTAMGSVSKSELQWVQSPSQNCSGFSLQVRTAAGSVSKSELQWVQSPSQNCNGFSLQVRTAVGSVSKSELQWVQSPSQNCSGFSLQVRTAVRVQSPSQNCSAGFSFQVRTAVGSVSKSAAMGLVSKLEWKPPQFC